MEEYSSEQVDKKQEDETVTVENNMQIGQYVPYVFEAGVHGCKGCHLKGLKRRSWLHKEISHSKQTI